MKALSIMQPWAWLVAAGHKDIENRDWRPANPGLRFRGRFLIHAGKRMDPAFDGGEGDIDWRALPFDPQFDLPEYLDFGGIVGEAEVVDVVSASPSPWFFGPLGLVIRNARLLPFQACRGALGFFDPANVPAPTPRPKRGTPDLFATGGGDE